MKKLSYIIFLVLMIIVIASIGCLAACKDTDDGILPDKRAIIVLPGILGSALMGEGAEMPFWDPLTADINLADFFDNPFATVLSVIQQENENGRDIWAWLTSVVEVEPGTTIDMLQLDENGNSVNNVIPVPWEYEGRQRYSAVNAYKPMWETMNTRYGDYYDVRVFNYDWRLDNRKSAEALESFINANRYTDVILCAQSMGNCVVADYLARSEANRAKVSAFCSFAGPFLGSFATLGLLENPNGIIEALDGFDISSIPIKPIRDFISGIMDSVREMYNNYCKEGILRNMATMVQMLPRIELAESLQYIYGEEFVNYDGSPITTNEELVAFYQSRPWAIKKDNTLKPYAADLLDYFNSSFVEVNGILKHSTELVNTFYFAGTGVLTTDQVFYDEDGVFDYEVMSLLGDGAVPLYSAIPLKDFDADNITADNVMIFDGYDHLDCGCVFSEELTAATYEFVDKSIPSDILASILAAAEESEVTDPAE